MAPIDRVQFSQESGFDLECAIELANLISVAYNEYEVWDTNKNLQNDKLLPETITGSKAFIDLNTNELEQGVQNGNSETNRDYRRLDKFWHQQKDKVETYERLDNFWFPEWWWLDALKFRNLWEFFNSGIRNIFRNFQDLIVDEPIFGFIARSKTENNKFFVVFRGTREAAEWFNNFRPVPKPFLKNEQFKDLGEVRNGFNLIYSSKPDRKSKNNHSTIQQTIAKFFKEQQINDDSKIFVTGHSLGSGLSTLAALHIHKLAELNKVKPSIQLYTFASPRVGDEAFTNHFDTISSFRIINSEDLIQSVPLPTTQVIDDEHLKV